MDDFYYRPFKSILHKERSGVVFHTIKNKNISKSNLNENDPVLLSAYTVNYVASVMLV